MPKHRKTEVIREEQASVEDAEITLPALIKRLETEMKHFGTQKRLAEAMERIVPHLDRFAVVGDIPVSTNPNPAALPWAAVRFLLLVHHPLISVCTMKPS